MKKIAFFALFCFFCTHLCAITLPKPFDPVVITVNLPKEQVWQRIVDLFVANSMPIKLMDKSSGLIQSDRVGLGSHYALKHTRDSTAWAFCETIKSPEGDSFYLFPQVVNAELQVYIRETADGNVLVSLNLMNIMAASQDSNTGNNRDFAIQSTQILENLIGNYLKTNQRIPSLVFDSPLATFGEAPSQVKRRETLAKASKNNDKKKEDEATNTALGLLGVIVLFVLLVFGTKKNEE